MSGSQSTPPAGFSCPQKGAFYVCAESAVRFVGCCASDPCGNGGVCADDDLATATFSADSYADIPPQNCSASVGADWYTCKSTSPPFLGCCVSNPCTAAASGGCPRADLRAAQLADDEFLAAPFLDYASSSSSTPSSPSPTTSTVSAPQPSGQATTSSSSLSVGVAAGIAVGGCALLAVIGVLTWWLLRQRRRARTAAIQGDQMTVVRGPGIPPSQPSPPYSPYKGMSCLPQNQRNAERLQGSSALTRESQHRSPVVRPWWATPLLRPRQPSGRLSLIARVGLPRGREMLPICDPCPSWPDRKSATMISRHEARVCGKNTLVKPMGGGVVWHCI